MDAVRIDGPVESRPQWETGGIGSWIGRLGGGLPASSLLIGAIVSMQCGAALATGLFARVALPAPPFCAAASARSC